MPRPLLTFDHDTETARAATECHARMILLAREGRHPRFHLYFKPYRLEAFHDDEPDPRANGWTLAWSESIPGNASAEQLRNYFRDRTGRIPYLIDEPAAVSAHDPMRDLACDQDRACPEPVAYVDEKGFTYCAGDGVARKGHCRIRKLRPGEIKALARRETITY